MSNDPQRSVEINQLVSERDPQLRVEIEPALSYVGNLNATVSNQTDIDNYYFVESDGEIIQRILYFQFEKSPNALSYPTMKSIEIGDYAFKYDGGVRMYRQFRVEEQAHDSDVRQTVDFLQSQQVKFGDGDYYSTMRFIHPVADDGTQDVLIIYLERVQEADVPQDIIAKSRASGEWQGYCDQLLARALRTFTICED